MTEEVKTDAALTVEKPAWLSKGVMGPFVALVISLLAALGVAVTPADGDMIFSAIDVVYMAIAMISQVAGLVVGLIGRIGADTKIRLPFSKGK